MLFHPLAAELNGILQRENPILLDLLSAKGKQAYFPRLSVLSQASEAKGKRYDASIGIATEDDRTPMHLSSMHDLVSLDPREVYPYATAFGKPELRTAWQESIRAKNPSLRFPLSLPVATSGLTHALSITAHLFVDPGDRVLLPDRFWDNYEVTYEMLFGAKLQTFPMFAVGGFATEGLRRALAEGGIGKKILLLNFPNNPTGYAPTLREAEEIAAILRASAEQGNTIVVFIDDAYFGFVYEEGVERESLFARLGDLHERILAVKIDGASKEEFAWGLRVAFVTYASRGMTVESAKALEEKTGGVVRGSISNVSNLSQSLVLAAMRSPAHEDEKRKKFEILRSRFSAVKTALASNNFTDCFTPLPFNSGYFMCVELASDLDAEAVRKKLLSSYDTGVIAYGSMIRIAFSSLAEKDIAVIFDNIARACRDVRGS